MYNEDESQRLYDGNLEVLGRREVGEDLRVSYVGDGQFRVSCRYVEKILALVEIPSISFASPDTSM